MKSPTASIRDSSGAAVEFRAQGARFRPEAVVADEMRAMHGVPS